MSGGEAYGPMAPSYIVSDDWEIQEPTVTFTKTQFWDAVYSAFECKPNDGAWGGIIQYSGGEPPPLSRLVMLARKLGLE